jgi:hypothetical protein
MCTQNKRISETNIKIIMQEFDLSLKAYENANEILENAKKRKEYSERRVEDANDQL